MRYLSAECFLPSEDYYSFERPLVSYGSADTQSLKPAANFQILFCPDRRPAAVLNKTTMSTDAELLRRFVEDRSETAFTELVHRYLSLVRGTALRCVGGDVHAADDITQQVFVSLARKASSLRGHATLADWLYVSTHHASAELDRREQSRKQREATAHSMQLSDSSGEPSEDAARLRPLLDDEGRSTPRSTIATLLWPAAGGDLAAFQNAIEFDDAARAAARAWFETLPPATRSLYATPEDLVASATIKNIPATTAQLS